MGRKTICLNGEWEFMPVYGAKACLDLPEKLVFEKEKIIVPSSWRYVTFEKRPHLKPGFGMVDDFQPFNMFDYPPEWSKADTGVYRRTFVLHDDFSDERIFLRLDGILQTSKVYLNGEVAAVWDESYLPLKVDVTGMIKPCGCENELIIVCSTFEETVIESGGVKSLGLIGSWFGTIGRGIWQDVFLESSPNVFIEDAFINTSFREKKISAEVSVCNKSIIPGNIKIKSYVSDDSGRVFEFGDRLIQLEPNETCKIIEQESWENPRLWNPDDPYLYHLNVELYKDGKVIDIKTFRFGFRETWSEGHKFFLNGERVNLRGDSWHFQGTVQQTGEYALNWFRMCKENGLNFVRLHAEPHPEYYLDAADEAGIMTVVETAIYGSHKSMAANHPTFINRCKKHVERLVRRDRNHPSVILWSLQNEMRWVDGRDTYKQHMPEMMEIVRGLDSTRLILLEGDNRLLPKEKCDIESYHYNIDGTISQWDKKRPLIYGEHGGWWYVSPQNSSNYAGLDAYLDFDNSSKGLALKEKYYVEYARRSEVTGITSFNFAHYLMKSMPDEDIELNWDRLDIPGCKPRVIKKHSLTINNGLLKDYPAYRKRTEMDILRDSYRPVTIIPVEYDSSFFDKTKVERNYDVYNDSLAGQECFVKFEIRLSNGSLLYENTFDFYQEAGERKSLAIAFETPEVSEPSEMHITAALYHGSELKYRLDKKNKLYPSALKTRPFAQDRKKAVYYGGDRDFGIISGLLPECTRLENLNEINVYGANLLIIGSYINSTSEKYHKALDEFVENGGNMIVLEQSVFAPGNLSLVRQAFFSAHINDGSHEILKGISNEDLIFWKPYILEDKPEDIVKQSFIKPIDGNVNIILEASAGDFGDGGDLWTPLVEYRHGKGNIIFNQLELIENYNKAPQACILLRNLIEYSLYIALRPKADTALIAEKNSAADILFEKIGLEYRLIDNKANVECFGIVAADPDSIDEKLEKELCAFVEGGGCLIILPADTSKEEMIGRIVGTKVRIEEVSAFQLNKALQSEVLKGVSIVDLFRYEKVICSPRMVECIEICSNTIDAEGGEVLLESVEGTPWHEYYVRNNQEEFCIPALADIKKKNKRSPLPYVTEIKKGKGKIILSQISTNSAYEKNTRIYGRLLSNSGSDIKNRLFSYTKGHSDYSADYMMTLPHETYKDYDKALEYYTDKKFSLNNLGEGLYGWMQKIEKDVEKGFISIPESKGKAYFLSCFPVLVKDLSVDADFSHGLDCTMEVDSNCSFEAYLNGRLVLKTGDHTSGKPVITESSQVKLESGLNRFILVCFAGVEDIKIRPVFLNVDGTYVNAIKYQLTMDEVDPK